MPLQKSQASTEGSIVLQSNQTRKRGDVCRGAGEKRDVLEKEKRPRCVAQAQVGTVG